MAGKTPVKPSRPQTRHLKPGYHGQKRRKGVPNKITSEIRGVVRMAASLAGDSLAASGALTVKDDAGNKLTGEVAYLVDTALNHRAAFNAVYSKCIPQAVEGNLGGDITIRVITGVPRDPVAGGEPNPS